MAILIRCTNCKNEMKLSTKKCKKCGRPIPKKQRTYKVIIQYEGKRRTRITSNYALAQEIETKLKNDIARKEFNIEKVESAPELNAFWEEQYLPWLKQQKKSWKIDLYNYNKHISPQLGSLSLDRISPFDIEKLILSLKEKRNNQNKPLSKATIKHQIQILNRIFNIAEKWGKFRGSNPCKKIDKPRLNNEITEFLSNEDLNRLLRVLESWDNRMQAGIVLFALYTGLRRGEIFRLTHDDIDFERKTVTIKDPKGKLDQILPLSDKSVDVLSKLPRDYESPYIFYSTNGRQRKTIRHGWEKIKTAAGLPSDFRFHGIRHHFASALVSAGVDLYTVQKLLCHKDFKTTQRYAHLSDDTLRNAVNYADKLNSKKERS